MTSANEASAASGTAPTATESAAPTEPMEAAPPGPTTAEAAATEPAPPEPAAPAAPEPLAPEPATPEPATPEPAGSAAVEDQTPFWMPWHPRWPTFPARRPRHPVPRRPAFGVFTLVALGLVATFFAWVSAEPLWLALGHGDRGTATATHCSIEGAPYECVIFTADGGRYVAEDITLRGTEHGHLRQGASVPANMVSQNSSRAYAVDVKGLRLQSAAGLVVLLLCGLGVAWATGATRLEPPATRRGAFLACLAAPLLLTLGFLAATW